MPVGPVVNPELVTMIVFLVLLALALCFLARRITGNGATRAPEQQAHSEPGASSKLEKTTSRRPLVLDIGLVLGAALIATLIWATNRAPTSAAEADEAVKSSPSFAPVESLKAASGMAAQTNGSRVPPVDDVRNSDAILPLWAPKEVLELWYARCGGKDEFKVEACERRRAQRRMQLEGRFRLRTNLAKLGKYDHGQEAFPLVLRHPLAHVGRESMKVDNERGSVERRDGAWLTVERSLARAKRAPATGAFPVPLGFLAVPRDKAPAFKKRNQKLLVDVVVGRLREWSYERGASVEESYYGIPGATVFGLQISVEAIRICRASAAGKGAKQKPGGKKGKPSRAMAAPACSADEALYSGKIPAEPVTPSEEP